MEQSGLKTTILRSATKPFAALAAATCVLFAGSAAAEPQNEADRIGGIVYDVGVLRTTGLLKLVIGSALWVPAYPMSLGSEQNPQVTESLVTEPARDTFQRPLGDF